MHPSQTRILARKDVLAGLMFIAVAVFGLWASRNDPIGTTLRMGTGYVPRLLCWLLLGLGFFIMLVGLRARGEHGAFDGMRNWRALLFVPASLLVFAYAMNALGLIPATVLLVVVGAFSDRDLHPIEVAATAIALVVLVLVIFVWGLELPIPIWPER